MNSERRTMTKRVIAIAAVVDSECSATIDVREKIV